MDNIKSAAKTIREALVKIDFGLQDKFCDAKELKHSLSTTRMPDELTSFFSALLNIEKNNITETLLQWRKIRRILSHRKKSLKMKSC